MRIRTQLILVFLLLSVLPLGGLVLYSYVTSQRALEAAAKAEADQMTAEMQSRMADVQADLGRRVERIGALPFLDLVDAGVPGAAPDRRELHQRLMAELGEVAPLVDSFEFMPAPQPHVEELHPTPEAAETMHEAAERAREAAARMTELRSFEIDVSELMQEVEQEINANVPDGLEREAAISGARVGLEVAELIVRNIGDLVQVDVESAAPETDAVDEGDPTPEPLPDEPPPDAPAAVWSIPESTDEETRWEWNEDDETDWTWRFENAMRAPVRAEGAVIGDLRARISTGRLLGSVLARTRRDQGEKPFALDPEGNLYVASDEDREVLERLPLEPAAEGRPEVVDDWVVVSRADPVSGLTFGLARPIGDSLAEMRRTAGRNFAWGLALIALAVLGILPLSAHLTRNLGLVTAGAQRIAAGDLEARVPVRSRNEVGELAAAFNRMAHDLQEQRQQLIDGERRRLDQEVETQVLQAEVDRKTEELEEARQFQLSMLPRELPRDDRFEVAVSMRTATEVGGDYYDFQQPADGQLVIAVGDATGHGARAGTMVTVTKSLFSSLPPGAAPGAFLTEASRTIRAMELGRMAMALTLVKVSPGALDLAAAGMPPALLHRHRRAIVEEIALPGVPLGSLAADYDERRVEVEAGDTLLLLSDGLPELADAEGQPFGYSRVSSVFEEHVAGSPAELIAALNQAADAWRGDTAISDDITFVALRLN